MDNRLDTWGNEATMNMNPILYQNILASQYFKMLYDKVTFDEIVNEIYNEVTNLSPFIRGTNPSTAFCCLFKFWTLRLTVKQLERLIDHPDSPYIRATGFLYLRYVCDPKQLWDWLGFYIDDDEEIDLTGDVKQKKSTIGQLCRMLLTEMKYQGTMLPRIPVPIARKLAEDLKEHDRQNGKKNTSQVPANAARGSASGGRAYRSRSRSPGRRDRGYRDDDRRHGRSDSRNRYHDRSRSRDRRSRYDDDDGYRRRSSPSPRRDRGHDRGRDRHRSRSRSSDRRRGHRSERSYSRHSRD